METNDSDALLLTRPAAARRIGFSREKFEREVAPKLTARTIGKRVYYHLEELIEVSRTIGLDKPA